MKKEKTWLWDNLPIIIAGAALVFAISLTTFNALGRYLFSRTLAWADELVAISFAYTVFFGCAAAYKRGMHYGLEFVSNAFKGRWKKVWELLLSVISLIFVSCLAYLSWVLTTNVGTKIFTASRISYRWFDLGMAIGFSLMVIYGIEGVISSIRKFHDVEVE